MKNSISKIIILFMLVAFSIVFCGCWDYTEMDDVKYVAGFAVDKDKDEYILTLEIMEASIGSNAIKSDIVQSRGKTIHSALRDAIENTGKVLQLSHAKVVIVSEEIAEEGIVPAIDLINRDVEVRNDMWILISGMDTASEILTKGKIEDEIISYELAETIKNSNKIGKYNSVESFKFISDLSNKGIDATAPMVKTVKQESKVYFQVFGTAVFKQDKMIGKLNEEEAVTLQILREKNPIFIIPIELHNKDNVSLEIMNTNRKLKVKTENNKIYISTYINIDVAISELAEEEVNYISKENREKLKKQVEEYIDKNANELIQKLQKEYKSDIVGFGDLIRKDVPKEWRKIGNKWKDKYQDTDIKVYANVNIKYSGLNKQNIKVRE
ncbi:Ger(x)C family spore germination protein [Haloimpatiens massiliensis]|uniref:Ger(x)C family spore germination protein n=1 Tax=Haloimpatiens massiliensis TaxID=1658110 RepID=UPI000C857199|nr:Ger(x)C family spore germination protein [Haloimpatiens massiliensis]